MPLQLHRRTERLKTLFTSGPLPNVDLLNVKRPSTVMSERLIAPITLVGLLPGVQTGMLL